MKNQAKAKLLTSLFIGALLPWVYFIVVRIGPLRYIDNEGTTVSKLSGISGFIEFNGVFNSIIIYFQTATVCACIVFIICNIYVLIEVHYKNKA